MKNIIDFLTQLHANNNREWFNARKAWYKEVQAEFNEFTEKLIAGIESFDPFVRGLTPKDCTFRIYRDTRFSKDKSPYKTHMGAYVCPKGRNSGYAGYYFHVEPSGENLPGEGNLLSVGIYMPRPIVLRSIREEIEDNGARIIEAIGMAHGFTLDQSNKLKRLPAGFAPGSEFEEYLKLKDLYIYKPLTNRELMSEDLFDRTIESFRSAYPLTEILNRAVEYAHQEMM